MFSKRSLTLSLVVVIGLSFVSCAFEDQKIEEQKKLDLFASKTQCLDDFTPALERFFESSAHPMQVHELWNCGRDILNLFLTHARPNAQGEFQADDLRDFIEDFFLEGSEISDELLVEAMKVKQLFLGGSLTAITLEEILSTQQLIEELRVYSLDLLPYMSILTLKRHAVSKSGNPISEEEMQQATAKLLSVAEGLSGRVGRLKALYKFRDLEKFLQQISLFFASEGWTAPEKLIPFVPVLAQLKRSLVSEPAEHIQGSDWSPMLNYSVRLYIIYLRFHYQVSPFSAFARPGFDHLNAVLTDVESFLRMIIKRQPQQVISYEKLDDLISAIFKADIFPFSLSTESTKSVIRLIVGRLPFVQNEGVPVTQGLGIETLDFYRSEFDKWRAVQSDIVEKEILNIYSDTSTKNAKEQMQKLISGPWPLVVNSKNRVVIRFDQALKYDLKSLSNINMYRALFHVLARSYGDPAGSEGEAGLNEKKLKKLFDDIFPIAVDMGFLTEKDQTIWTRILNESSLFMPRSNGNRILSLEEALEFLTFYLSAQSTAKDIRAHMEVHCPTQSVDQDVFIDAICFRQKMQENWGQWYAHLPQLTLYWSSLNAEDLKDWQNYSEMAVRSAKEKLTDPLNASDITLISMLYQYIETYYGRFDSDRSQRVNKEESLVGAPVYVPTLMDLSGLGDEKDATAVYTFMFKHGRPPKGVLEFVWWRWNPEKWVYDTQRLGVIKILAELARQRGANLYTWRNRPE